MPDHESFPDHLPTPHSFLSCDGGVSSGVYESLNCGPGSNDDPDLVRENRRIAASEISGRRDTSLLSCYQIHSNIVVEVTEDWQDERPKADAMVTRHPGLILGILTADCTPVLFFDPAARVIAAAHAGWKGALGGVVENTVAAMEKLGADRGNIAAAVGPAIARSSYEVGADFEARFTSTDTRFAAFFGPGKDNDHRQFDLPGFVRSRLSAAGVDDVLDCSLDTYTSESHFSFRRTTHRGEHDYGRQLSGIMLSQ